jgi:hypothetical protein
VVGGAIAALFLKTAFAVLQQSLAELQKLNQDLSHSATEGKV